MKQLNFDIVQPMHVQRRGLVGVVQAYVEAYPWKECGEIAAAIKASPIRVSNCLNKLKLEGNAQQRKGMGKSNKSLWAGTSETLRTLRDDTWAKIEPVCNEAQEAKMAVKFRAAMRSGNHFATQKSRGIGLAKLFTYERVEA